MEAHQQPAPWSALHLSAEAWHLLPDSLVQSVIAIPDINAIGIKQHRDIEWYSH